MSAPELPGLVAGDDDSGPSGLLPRKENRAQRDRPLAAFRFVQTSEFRLDCPCFSVPGLPDSLRDRFVDARYIAAERVFDAAIEHEVDFVLLAGGLLDPGLPGLRGPWFLAEQFRRLADHAIDVYWAGATLETRGRWPAHAALPTNVHRLTADDAGILHGRNGHPVARILTMPPDVRRPQFGAGAFAIAVQPRCEGPPEQGDCGIDYWALGGLLEQETIPFGDVVAHFSGSPQGRSPSETGRHSCSLVDVGTEGDVSITPIDTDVIRWHHRQLEIEAATTWSELEQQLTGRISELRSDTIVDLQLVRWTVTGGGLAVQRLLEPRLLAELINRLNANQSKQSPVIWTIGIDAVVGPAQRAEWHSQQTPLGAFLRELDDLPPHVHEKFGSSTDDALPFERCRVQANDRIIQHVINEGVHRLGTHGYQARQANN